MIGKRRKLKRHAATSKTEAEYLVLSNALMKNDILEKQRSRALWIKLRKRHLHHYVG